MARGPSPESDATASSSMLSSPSLYNQQVFQDARQPPNIVPAAPARVSEFSSCFLTDSSLERLPKGYCETIPREMCSCTCHSSAIQGQSSGSHSTHADVDSSRAQGPINNITKEENGNNIQRARYSEVQRPQVYRQTHHTGNDFVPPPLMPSQLVGRIPSLVQPEKFSSPVISHMTFPSAGHEYKLWTSDWDHDTSWVVF
jgi:hypothetical protein